MNKYILKSTLALAVIMMASSCETTDYNETYFGDDGYDPKPAITDIQTIELTLTSDDYAAIASNSTNVSNAEAAGLSSELSAVATNECFSDSITGSDYIPAYLESLYGSYLSVGSRVNITYNTATDSPEELTYIMAGTSYTLTSDDYATAWGEEGVAYFTPSVSAASKLPTILKASLPDAEAGDYAIVTYSYSATEPSTGSDEEEEEEAVNDAIVATFDGSELPTAYPEDETVTVGGYDFVLNGVANFSTLYDSVTGPIQFVKSTSYLYNAVAIDGLTRLVITLSNSYNNFTVYAGTEANPLATAIDGVEEDSEVTYTLPSGSTYITICNEGTYTAYANQFDIYAEESPYDRISEAADVANSGNEFFVKGTVAATCTAGFILSDSSAAIYVYSSGHSYEVGDMLTIEGATSTYSNVTQFSASSVTITELGSGSMSYPTAAVMSGADFADYVADPSAQYVQFTGTLTVSGSYATIVVEGSDYTVSVNSSSADFSALSDSEVTFTGYINGYYGTKAYAVATSIESATSVASAPARASAAVVTSTLNAVYQFNGTSWSAADNTVILNSDDYTAMGSTYGNLSGTQPETYLPIYLGINYPYAVEGDYIDVVYKFYDSSTYYKASRFNKEGSDWVMYNNVEVVASSPFECMESGWSYNPSLTITFLPTSNDFATAYYQTAVDIITAEYGSDSGYLTSYGNTEYFSGCSSYYNNVAWRYDYILSAWTAAGVDFSPYVISGGEANLKALYAQLEENLASTFSKMLAAVHPDINAVSGMDVLYRVQYFAFVGKYDNDLPSHEMVFKVVSKGEFEFVEINVLQESYDYLSDENITYVLSTYGG